MPRIRGKCSAIISHARAFSGSRRERSLVLLRAFPERLDAKCEATRRARTSRALAGQRARGLDGERRASRISIESVRPGSSEVFLVSTGQPLASGGAPK